MAILPSSTTSVVRYAAGLYGVKLGNATLQAVQSDLGANPLVSLPAVLNAYYAPFAGNTSAQVAAIVVANAGIVEGRYGLTAAHVADAVAIVTGELNAAAPTGNQGVAIANILASWSNHSVNDAVYGAAAKAWNLKIAQATGYSANANSVDVAFGEVNTEFRLTGEFDRISGTDGDDTFIGNLGALNNADRIDGAGGFDTLKTIVNGVIAPTIANVEHLQFQAQFRTADSGDNNLTDEQVVKVDFNTNVTSVTGFTTIENNNSRADLIVEDVRIANNQVTKDITIVMRETDPGNVDYGVYFDQNSLRNVSTASSQINLRVLDTYATSLGLAPLKDSPYGAFTFSFSKDGAAPVSVKLESAAIQNAQTFPEMVAALQAAANVAFGAGVVTVATGATYTVPDSVTGAQVQGTEIVLAAKGNITFSTPAGSGWLATETVPAISGLHTSYTVGGATATELVTSNIILDDVGRGSTGGDLVVGGLSVGETSTSKGVQKFLIEVQDNSKLQTINSTNNTLQEVVIVNGITTRVNNAYNENEKNAGSLTVLGKEANNDGSGFGSTTNNAPLPGSAAQHNDYGFSDVRLIDGSAMTGKLNFDAEITSASIAKYLNGKDAAPALPATDNVAFVYSGGANNDTIDVKIDGAVLASNSLSAREDFSFTANGGAGNDSITVNIGGTSANWYADQKANANVFVNGGEGNDTIRTPGAGDVRIDAGAGNDTVYTDNSGTIGATWLVAAGNTALNDLVGANTTNNFLYKGKLTVAYSAPSTSGTVTQGAADSSAASFTNGWEVVVDIPTGANYSVTQLHINQAIKAAINGDAVLSKVLSAEDGPANTLIIKSLIDGTFTNTDLAMTVSAVDVTTLAAGEQSTVLAAYKTFAGNSAAVIADAQTAQAAAVIAKNGVNGMDAAPVLAANGAVNTAESDNTIALGAGDDVLVLGTGADSNEKLVFAGYNQGKDSIINFSETGANADKIDFTSYLNGKASASGSVDSQVRILTSLNGDANVDANSVTMLNGTFNTTTAKFADLSAAKLLAAVNSTNTGALDFAGISAITLDALNTYVGSGAGTTLVGGVGKAVVMVQNNLNEGEYAVFELTFNGLAANTSKDFSAAELIGVVDFGNTLTPALTLFA